MPTQHEGVDLTKFKDTIDVYRRSDSSVVTPDATKKKKTSKGLKAEELINKERKNQPIAKQAEGETNGKEILEKVEIKSIFDQRKKIIESGRHLPVLLKPVNIDTEKILHPFPSKSNYVNISNIFNKAIAKKAVIPKNKPAKPLKSRVKQISQPFAIALIDTGVFRDHPDLKPCRIKLYDSDGNESEGIGDDEHGHGTHIAGILAANGIMKGIAPGATIYSYRVTEGNSSHTTWKRIADALQRVVEHNMNFEFGKVERKISVVNLSYNSFDNLNTLKTTSGRIEDLVNQLYAQQVPVVVSGGNYFDAFRGKTAESSYGLAFPANLENVIACGACCYTGEMKSPSEVWKEVKEPDLSPFTQRWNPSDSSKLFVVAPAIATNSTAIGETPYAMLMGSSMAAPMVAGLIFLMQQIAFMNDKSPRIADIKIALRKGSHKVANEGLSAFKDDVKTSDAFFDKQKYLHIDAKKIIAEFMNLL